VIARKQKEDLDAKIGKTAAPKKVVPSKVVEPKDVSDHAQEKKVSDWYNKGEDSKEKVAANNGSKVEFDWEKTLTKKSDDAKAVSDKPEAVAGTQATPNIENKLDQLTESINKLVNSRFGSDEKKDAGVSVEMQELLKRLEKAEKENEENKKLIRSLQQGSSQASAAQSIFGESAIKIDKERKVDINHTTPKADTQKPSGNVQVTSVSTAIPIQKEETKTSTPVISSAVSKDTLDSIIEIRNSTNPNVYSNNIGNQTSNKKAFSLDELISKNDPKIKEASEKKPATPTLVFPGVNDEKKVDIKNINQKETMRQALLDDLEFLKQKQDMSAVQTKATEKTDTDNPQGGTNSSSASTDSNGSDVQNLSTTQQSTSNPFKDELLPKTKEERMRALQDKIKALNKGVSVGGSTNITASGLDPYRL
jgi:hypothetical protein